MLAENGKIKYSAKMMLVMNMTPDSFSDGGRWIEASTGQQKIDAILNQVQQTIDCGFNIESDILDIGGESTRPGAETIPEEIEIERIQPVIQAIHSRYPQAAISVDTRKANVAKVALAAGAKIINDVSGLQYDTNLARVVAESKCQLVLMHSIGTPETMQDVAKQLDCYPQGITQAVIDFFNQQINFAISQGIAEENIILDPGFGFGKTIEHNLTLLTDLSKIKNAFPNHQMLVGTSRKSFLSLGRKNDSLEAKDALTAASVYQSIVYGGADIVRIHNLEAIFPVIRLAESLVNASEATSSHESVLSV